MTGRGGRSRKKGEFPMVCWRFLWPVRCTVHRRAAFHHHMEKPVGRISRLTLFALPLALLWTSAGAEAQWRPIYPGYPPYRYAAPESDLRFDVEPKDASVYVDGYFAGKVDDFDGAFQRLHVAPGPHEIVVYLDGYRSLRQRLYLSPNTTRRIEGMLERLAAGETPEAAPVPSEDPEPPDPADLPTGRRPVPRPGPGDMRGRGPEDRRRPQDRPDPGDSRAVGSLSIRVQPSGATVLIDGERWSGPGNDERLIVQVPEGRHTIEVERDGFERFVTEIEVRRGQTAPVNISLTRAR